ncbi:MAG: S-layer homology domain-containing protein [Thermoleophilia bacterium]|nr:S-layer homology domain-containing protein [Thermoleophilia bacterium]
MRSKRALLVVGAGLGLLVCLLAVPALAVTFTDVHSDTWDDPDYPEAVGALSDLGIVTGYSDGTFRPHNTVIRQQFAKMIVKTLGLPVTGQEVCPFTDVAEDTPFIDPFYPDKYVAACASHGITKGKTATTFAPYDTITRAQVLTMVVRSAERLGVPLEEPNEAYYAGTLANSTFRNLKDSIHGHNVQIAEMNNLVWGIWPDTATFWDVKKEATRGEVVLILWRLWQKMNPSSTTTTEETSTTTTTEGTTTTTEDTTTTTEETTSTTLPAGNYWHQIEPAGVPPAARDRATMVSIPESGAAIMFGGQGVTDEAFSDTWRFDLTDGTWTQLAPTGTTLVGRRGSAAVYAAAGGEVVMFGGYGSGYLGDTWSYDPVADAWTQLQPGGRTPVGRHGHSMVYDSSRDKVIMFGGYDGGYLNDLWEYDPVINAWTELRPSGTLPVGRYDHSMLYDVLRHRVVLFAGQLNTGASNDLWEYDRAANQWTKVYPSGSAPSARAGFSMIYDSDTRQALLFGGRSNVAYDDCWAYGPAAETWTELQPVGKPPAARTGAAMIYDSVGDRCILFGGADAGGLYLGDIWELVP